MQNSFCVATSDYKEAYSHRGRITKQLTAFLPNDENKIPDHSKYITTTEFNNLIAENFSARLAQANLASKNDLVTFVKMTDFDDKFK